MRREKKARTNRTKHDPHQPAPTRTKPAPNPHQNRTKPAPNPHQFFQKPRKIRKKWPAPTAPNPHQNRTKTAPNPHQPLDAFFLFFPFVVIVSILIWFRSKIMFFNKTCIHGPCFSMKNEFICVKFLQRISFHLIDVLFLYNLLAYWACAFEIASAWFAAWPTLFAASYFSHVETQTNCSEIISPSKNCYFARWDDVPRFRPSCGHSTFLRAALSLFLKTHLNHAFVWNCIYDPLQFVKVKLKLARRAWFCCSGAGCC